MPSTTLGQITTFRLFLDYISRISRLSPTESRTSSRQMMRPYEEVQSGRTTSTQRGEGSQRRLREDLGSDSAARGLSSGKTGSDSAVRRRLSSAGTHQRQD